MVLKTLWSKANAFTRANFMYRTISSIYCIGIILTHVHERNAALSPIHYILIFSIIAYPSVTLFFQVRSKDQDEAALNSTITDLFICGGLIAFFQFSFVPSLILVLICTADYIAAKGSNSIYRLLLIPLGCLPIVLIRGFEIKNGTGIIEAGLSAVYGFIAFSFLANLTYQASQERKAKQKELEDKQLELAESNAVKDKLFSIITHDIRAPLNSLKGFLFLLNTKSIKEEEQEALSKNISNHFNYTSELVDNVLQWARSQMNGMTMAKECVDVLKITEKVVGLMHAQALKKNISIENNVQSFNAYADPNMVELVFRNLLANAIKFTNTNGKIKLSSTINHDVATFGIEDNGVGIAKESVPRLFRLDKTFTTLGTDKEKGSGLGLSLCKDFIERHGGQLWVESELGIGTKFYFTLTAFVPNNRN